TRSSRRSQGSGAEGFAVDASLIAADANKQRSVPGSEWEVKEDVTCH
ncbi:hypothetical protein GR247_41595, partial [Rhizobium leguminosarum]|nr:hypothetical protein [Rhizobium leguminosarum]NEK56248.1 hypothetical protein [Rhizobium leguminosarum]